MTNLVDIFNKMGQGTSDPSSSSDTPSAAPPDPTIQPSDPAQTYGTPPGDYQSMVSQAVPWLAPNVQADITTRLGMWSNAAPGLKPEMLLQFAEANISPTDPVGQWMIRTAVPAMGGRQPSGATTVDANAAAQVLSSPGVLDQLAHLPIDKLTNALKQSPTQIAQMMNVDDQLVQQGKSNTGDALRTFLETGNPNVHHSWLNKIGDIATTGIRDVATAAQSGADTVQAGVRDQTAGLFKSVSNLAHGESAGAGKTAGGTNIDPTEYNLQLPNIPHYIPALQNLLRPIAPDSPLFNTKTPTNATYNADFKFGGQQQLLDPGQITGVQALEGNSLGGGFFPGGQAQQRAVLAQQAAATINGHALTPGRALAAFAVQPGSRPYSIMSGIVDAQISMHADPASLLLGELSDVAGAHRVFSPTSDSAIQTTAQHLIGLAQTSDQVTALHDWSDHLAGYYDDGPSITDAIAQKLRTDPGSIQQLVDSGFASHADLLHAIAAPHTGMLSGLRNAVDTKTAMQWLNGRTGVNWAERTADQGLTDIMGANKNIPADVALRLADANTPDAVRYVVGQELGTTIKGIPTSVLPYAVKRPFESLRMAQLMPHGDYYGTDDPNNLYEQGKRYLQLASVPRSEWDGILKPVVAADGPDATYQAFVKGVYGRVQTSIEEHLNVPKLQERLAGLAGPGNEAASRALTDRIGNLKDLAFAHTRAWADQTEEDKIRWTGEIVGGQKVPGGVLADTDLPIEGPHTTAELLNTAIPALPNPRDIRHLTSAWAPIYENGLVNKSMVGWTHFNDFATGLFKTGALAKLALPVRFLFDEQARGASAGYDTMFHHPLSYLSWAAGNKGADTALGENWDDLLAERTSRYAEAVGQTAKMQGGLFDPVQIASQHWTDYGKGSPQYVKNWADSLSRLHIDPPTREVAAAVRDPENYAPNGIADKVGLDAVKEWFSEGDGQQWRDRLAKANILPDATGTAQSPRLITDRTFADSYIDSLAQRLQDSTQGHADLIGAVADGSPFKGPGQIDKDFTSSVKSLTRQINPETGKTWGPDTVRGPIMVTTSRRAVMDKAVDRMFSALMDKPSGTFTRSPIYRQAYYNDMQRLLPNMDEATQNIFIGRAAADGIDMTKPSTATGIVNLQKADKIAQANALGEVKRLLYYHSEKSNAADALRSVYPFANAMQSVVTSWAGLMAQNPTIIRRVQQGITAAREQGFFYTDPKTGKEVFNLVPPGIVDDLAGVPFPLTAPVQGLNVAGTGIPGMGPVVQMAAGAIIPHVPALQAFQKYVNPYGPPDYSGGALESLFPGWLQKIRATGWFHNVPFLGPTQRDDQSVQALAQQVFQYKMSSHAYNLSDPNVLNQLVQDSKSDAQKLYFLRGMAQFIAPAAPAYTDQVSTNMLPAAFKNSQRLKDGQLIETYKIVQMYHNLLTASNGDSYSATRAFVKMLGPNYIFATEPGARRTVFNIPTTSEAMVFKSQHPDFVSKFKDTYGWFAPQGGAFDYNAYLDGIQSGAIVPLKVQDWANLAEARLGNAMYAQVRSAMPSSPSIAQRNILDQYKQQLTNTLPGFNQNGLKLSSDNLDTTVNKLRQTIEDPAVRGTPLANTVKEYIQARDEVLVAQKKRTGLDSTTVSSAASNDGLRTVLFQIGSQLALQHPEFTNMWDNLFMHEVQNTATAADAALTAPSDPGLSDLASGAVTP